MDNNAHILDFFKLNISGSYGVLQVSVTDKQTNKTRFNPLYLRRGLTIALVFSGWRVAPGRQIIPLRKFFHRIIRSDKFTEYPPTSPKSAC